MVILANAKTTVCCICKRTCGGLGTFQKQKHFGKIQYSYGIIDIYCINLRSIFLCEMYMVYIGYINNKMKTNNSYNIEAGFFYSLKTRLDLSVYLI